MLVSIPERGCCQGRILLVKYPQYPPGCTLQWFLLAHEMSRAVVLWPPRDTPLAALPVLIKSPLGGLCGAGHTMLRAPLAQGQRG